jgi:hypothetical protein
MNTERELTIDELDAVSGGALGYIEARFPTAIGGGDVGGGGVMQVQPSLLGTNA